MFGDIGKLMKIAGEMKVKMPEIQARLAQSRHIAQSGGGAVTVVVNGKGQVIDVTISPMVLADQAMDAQMLGDLVKAALCTAQEKASIAASEAMKEITGGVELPPGMGL